MGTTASLYGTHKHCFACIYSGYVHLLVLMLFFEKPSGNPPKGFAGNLFTHMFQLTYTDFCTLIIDNKRYNTILPGRLSANYIPDFEVVPDPTNPWLAITRQLVFKRQSPDSYLLLGQLSPAAKVQLTPQPSPLVLFLLLTNPDIPTFVSPPMAGSIYYFTNKQSQAAPRTALPLTQTTDTDPTMDIIRRQGDTYLFQTTGAPEDVILRHVASQKEVAPVSVTTAGAVKRMQFNLQTEPMGKYDLHDTGILKDACYFLPKGQEERLCGVIELFMDSSPPAHYRMVEPDKTLQAQKPVYQIIIPV